MSTTTTATTIEQPKYGVVNITLNYYLDPEKGGHTSYQIGTSSYYRRKFEPHTAQIHNIRGREKDFNLDTHGFQRVEHVSAERKFDNVERVKQIVYPEIEQLVRNVTGAAKVHVFSHVIRKNTWDEVVKQVNSNPDLTGDSAPVSKVTPARFIHVDYSSNGAAQTLKDNFDREPLSGSRWSFINVWRRIKPISKDPLAVCDAQSVREEASHTCCLVSSAEGHWPVRRRRWWREIRASL